MIQCATTALVETDAQYPTRPMCQWQPAHTPRSSLAASGRRGRGTPAMTGG
jgi:hypothetical protein